MKMDGMICQSVLLKRNNFTVRIREIKTPIGAGFLVALAGDIMTMPGLLKVPTANNMDVVEGKIVGLF